MQIFQFNALIRFLKSSTNFDHHGFIIMNTVFTRISKFENI